MKILLCLRDVCLFKLFINAIPGEPCGFVDVTGSVLKDRWLLFWVDLPRPASRDPVNRFCGRGAISSSKEEMEMHSRSMSPGMSKTQSHDERDDMKIK